MRVAIVTGEASGDLLGASLLEALQRQHPGLQAEGVAGPALQAAGCEVLADAAELAVMGLSEVLRDLPRLYRLRRRLLAHWRSNPPDVFIGVDAPDFNLGLERRLRDRGIRTVHYVSPTVWAWRPGRVHTVARAADLLLCLFPFEPACYTGLPLQAEFVGHPFAEECARVADKPKCRAALGVETSGPVVALLPGSRLGELRRSGEAIAGAAAWLHQRLPALQFIVPAANAAIATGFDDLCREQGIADCTRIHDGRAREVLRAADVAIVTSGTATLEAMLLGTPFLATYRAAPSTAWLMRNAGLLKLDDVAMPNILAGRRLAPELIQQAAIAPVLGAACYQLLTQPHLRSLQLDGFQAARSALLHPTAERAAAAVLKLCRPV